MAKRTQDTNIQQQQSPRPARKDEVIERGRTTPDRPVPPPPAANVQTGKRD